MRWITSVSVPVLALTVGLSPALAETLDDALAAAYGGSPVLSAQRAKLRASAESVPQALSNWRPTVKLTGDVGRQDVYNTAISPRGQDLNNKDAALVVSQPLYRGGRTVAQTAQAEAQLDADLALLTANEQTVLLAAVTAYTAVVQDRAVVALNRNNEQVLEKQLEATRDRFRVGEVTRTDVAQSESRLSAAHAARIQAEGQLQASLAGYQTVIGHLPAGGETLPALPAVPGSLEDARAAALAGNPQISAAAAARKAADHGVDVVFGELLPQLSLNGTISRVNEASYRGSGISTKSAMLTLTVPLYQGGQEYSRLRQQKQVAAQRSIEVEATRRDVTEQTTRAWEAVTAARAARQALQDQVSAAEVALEGTRRESQVGQRTVLDVLNSEQELLTARVSLVRADHDLALSGYQLLAGLGQLTAQRLALPVERWDGRAYADRIRDKWIGSDAPPQ